MTFQIISGANSHLGHVRARNEDTFLRLEGMDLYLVADGMGGPGGGDVASAIACDVTARSYAGGKDLKAAFEDAHEAVLAAGREKGPTDMGTTLVALALGEGGYLIAWSGDSRIYVFEDGRLSRLSRDHSYVQDLVDEGRLRPEEAFGHPASHVITHALGMARKTVRVDLDKGRLRSGQRFLLCTDGLTDLVKDAAIEEMMAEGEAPLTTCNALIGLALDAGGRDNITALIVDVD